MQMPPRFSAIKVDGERAYDLARAGETSRSKPARWRFISLRLVGQPDADHAVFEADAAKAPMCARWRAIWAACSAASAM